VPFAHFEELDNERKERKEEDTLSREDHTPKVLKLRD